ncbi:MAG: hypothetical protein QW310_03780, partial [Thermoproteota archaeon]
LGNSLVEAGEMNIEQSNIIKNATRNLEAQINTTQSQLNELMNKINDVEKNLENVRNEIKSLDNKQKELIYISPEILDENYIVTINGGGKIFQENITSAFKKDSIFIQYLILYNNSDKPIVIPIFNFAKETKESLFDLNGVPLNITLGSSSSYVTVIARVGEVNDLKENYFANIVQYNIANVNISKNQFNFNPSKKQESFTNYQYLLVPICIVAGFVVVAMYSKSLIQKSKRRKKLNKILSRIKLT